MQKFLGQGSKASHSSDNGDTLTAKPLEKSNMIHLGVFVCLLFFSLEVCTCGTWKFPGQGLNWSCSYRPTPQPQQGLILNPLRKEEREAGEGQGLEKGDAENAGQCWDRTLAPLRPRGPGGGLRALPQTLPGSSTVLPEEVAPVPGQGEGT